jgi:hypothetical protein
MVAVRSVLCALAIPVGLAAGAGFVGCGSSTGAPSTQADVDASDDSNGSAPPDDGGDAATSHDAAADGSSDAAGGMGVADAGDSTDARSSPESSTGSGDAAAEGGTMMSVYVTFYGWADNSPPGGAIAYPMNGGFPTLHDTAGGTGTYADPITFASDEAEFAVGTILYVPFIEKYVIMEDDCVECDSDWTSTHKWHTDLWMNSSASESSSALIDCEDSWTRDSTVVEVDPPATRTVTTSPLFDPSTNTCRTTP